MEKDTKQNQDLALKPSKGLSKAEPWTIDEKKTFALLLARVFDAQKQYGKTSDQLSNVIEVFNWVLKDYPAEKCMWALGEYIKRNADIPTPSNLISIIDPIREEPKPDKGYYIKLQNLLKVDGPYALNDEERKYIFWYEEQMRKGLV